MYTELVRDVIARNSVSSDGGPGQCPGPPLSAIGDGIGSIVGVLRATFYEAGCGRALGQVARFVEVELAVLDA